MSDPSWILSGDLRVVWEKIIGIFSKSYGIFSANSPFDSFSLLYKGKPFKRNTTFSQHRLNIAVWSSEQPLFFIIWFLHRFILMCRNLQSIQVVMMGLLSFFQTAAINLWISWLKEDYFDNWLFVSFFKPGCSVFVGSSFLNMRICCFLWPLW